MQKPIAEKKVIVNGEEVTIHVYAARAPRVRKSQEEAARDREYAAFHASARRREYIMEHGLNSESDHLRNFR